MRAVPLLGRILFSLIFVFSALGHFSPESIDYAASAGVPAAAALVPISGILALAGGLSILLGFKTRIGAWLLVLFLVPVTFMMHDFWNLTDPQARQLQFIMFMKNIALLGGALAFAYFGPGPYSLDARLSRRHPASRPSAAA